MISFRFPLSSTQVLRLSEEREQEEEEEEEREEERKEKEWNRNNGNDQMTEQFTYLWLTLLSLIISFTLPVLPDCPVCPVCTSAGCPLGEECPINPRYNKIPPP